MGDSLLTTENLQKINKGGFRQNTHKAQEDVQFQSFESRKESPGKRSNNRASNYNEQTPDSKLRAQSEHSTVSSVKTKLVEQVLMSEGVNSPSN